MNNPLPDIPARPDRIPDHRAVLELHFGQNRRISWVWNSYDPEIIRDKAWRHLAREKDEPVDVRWVWRDLREAE